MQEVELSGGRIRYRDHGEGRPIVFVHGVFVNSALWRKVEPPLVAAGFRCVAPDWPLGAHIAPMSADADVTPRGVARLIGEFLDRLDLSDVTLVANDTGGAIAQLLLAEGCDRVARVVLTPCDSFDNFLPPSIRSLQYLARVPGAVKLGAQILRSGRLRRLVFRTLAKRPIPDDVTASWVRPMLTNREIRRDTARFLSAIDHRDTAAAAERLRGFARPVLLLWPRKALTFRSATPNDGTSFFPTPDSSRSTTVTRSFPKTSPLCWSENSPPSSPPRRNRRARTERVLPDDRHQHRPRDRTDPGRTRPRRDRSTAS
jgi:pimeloyl-ACP methyl ester carboxylesterase